MMGGPVRRAGLVFAAAFAMTACGARPAPATPTLPPKPVAQSATAAVSNVAVELLETHADSDVVSPAGIDAALCALAPVMSEAVRRQRRAASERDCAPSPAYVVVSHWLERSMRISAAGEALLRAGSEFHREPAPISVPIQHWLQKHDALQVPLREPLEFVTVSVLDYGRAWAKPFAAMPKSVAFHGKKRTVHAPFLGGWQFASAEGPCVRAIMMTADGGYVMLAALEDRPPAAAFHCLGRAVHTDKFDNAEVIVPRLYLKRCASIGERLQRLGFRDAFNPATEPFPKLWHGAALGNAIQAAELKLDENGIRVRATTSFNIPLGVPRMKWHLTYDHPFAMRVVAPDGVTVAVAIVNDLPARTTATSMAR